MLIGVLVVLAAALLISAFLTGTTWLAGAALVVSLAAAVLYVLMLRRAPAPADAPAEPAAAATDSEPATADAATPAAEAAPAQPAAAEAEHPEVAEPTPGAAEVPEPTPTKTPEPAPTPVVVTPEPATARDGAAVVHVVPGRMRYHVDGCEVLDGHDAEALTVDDARDEGFTACSRCAVGVRTTAKA
ncbi:hypothetical protein [Actinomycetospora sp. TBRC 11914]|uniref:hypothetical protein n=1 Tax=Actinomycetospora sp. TBRC 11914 TaxID=2729387 RepID=UPI00145F66D9|nr:hypothetical protein [Actinomycetospora sp. TBRC 11914]NMO92281.1 hypothetical protein [Actinomycetospora sp. TBRC 11914]